MARKAKRPPISIQHRMHLFERLYAQLKASKYNDRKQIAISFKFGASDPDKAIEDDLPDHDEFVAYLARFQQLIKPNDECYLPKLLGELPRHIDNQKLRDRLHRASDAFKAAQGVHSPLAAVALGPFAAGEELAKLYLHGGIFHSDPAMSEWWDRIGPNNQQTVQYEFRMYESRVRNVVIELKKIITAARDGGHLRDQPLDLRSSTQGSTP
jgi:hypothetical protein